MCLVQIPILTTISTYALPFQEDLQSTGYLSRLVARGFVDSLLVRLIHLALLQLPIRDDPYAALVSAFAMIFLIYVKRSNHHINICPLNNKSFPRDYCWIYWNAIGSFLLMFIFIVSRPPRYFPKLNVLINWPVLLVGLHAVLASISKSYDNVTDPFKGVFQGPLFYIRSKY